MEYMTVHRAKGLGYDNVIIINAIDSIYGFPSKIQDDPVLKYVVLGCTNYSPNGKGCNRMMTYKDYMKIY